MEFHYNVYGCYREPLEDLALAKKAVQAGFEGIWMGDHFHPWIHSRPYTHQILPWFGALMNEVPEVPVGTSVTCPVFRYEPPVLAHAIATLDNMYPGRFNLGVGTGEALNEASFCEGEWPNWGTRAEMLVESIEVMRNLWTAEGYTSHRGKHFHYEDLCLYTKPKERIDIHWAAWGPQSCKYAGMYADHLITDSPPDRVEEQIIPHLSKGLKEVGRDISDVHISTEFPVNIGDPDALVQEIRDRGEYVPFEAELDNPDPRSIQQTAEQKLADTTDEEIREGNNITDDPDDVVEKIERMEDAGVTRVFVGSNCGDPVETIEAFEESILPHFSMQ